MSLIDSAGARTVAELNVEARSTLAFKAEEAAVASLLPAGWKASPQETGPSKGANVIVIFSDRLLIQSADGKPMEGQATNQIAVLAVPALNPNTNERGVMIVFGLSARSSGAPGPYGVFLLADEANVERIFRSGPGDENRVAEEQWSFAAKDGERLSLRLRYKRGIPNRANTEIRAYSAYDPSFYRTYSADQGADVLRSSTNGKDIIDEIHFSAGGPRLGALFDASEQLVSVIALPWTVRQAFLPFHASVLQLQALDPAEYTKAYRVREQTLWVDSPSRTYENGLLLKEQRVWLDKELPANAQGVCRVKLEDNKLAYAVEVANLVKE
jgi:hypothetical protein